MILPKLTTLMVWIQLENLKPGGYGSWGGLRRRKRKKCVERRNGKK